MEQQTTICLPKNSFVVLCGSAGSGKSTFAAEHFKSTQIVSSDVCRALICDNERNQRVTRDAFELFHTIIQMRLKQGRVTVADSTALYAFARTHLLDLALQAHFHTCLIVFNVAFDICKQRDQQRTKKVPLDVIYDHSLSLQRARKDVHQEGWDQIYELGADVTGVRVV